ncbi:MAG: fasciclin domain-containing protein [Algoriphagus sp.]|nr:fasciclin domain-containing protein [Algoriphagus sp.]
MKHLLSITFGIAVILVTAGCGGQPAGEATADSSTESAPAVGQSGVQDSESKPNVVQVAVGSPDHTTLVAALQAAEYVDVLTNVGPFTVFAPTNAAFDLLPAGTVDNLVKPENQRKLRDILEYHVLLGVYKPEDFVNGRNLGTADGRNVTIAVAEDGTVTINGAKIIGTVPASNGIIHVIDQVLIPADK